jgi:hypothetical protein
VALGLELSTLHLLGKHPWDMCLALQIVILNQTKVCILVLKYFTEKTTLINFIPPNLWEGPLPVSLSGQQDFQYMSIVFGNKILGHQDWAQRVENELVLSFSSQTAQHSVCWWTEG